MLFRSGVIVCWIDHRSGTRDEIYAQRLNALGVPQWTSNGILASSLGTASKPQYSVCTDAAGGAFVAWRYDLSVADNDIFGTHVSSAGLATVFSVYTPTLIQTNPQISQTAPAARTSHSRTTPRARVSM